MDLDTIKKNIQYKIAVNSWYLTGLATAGLITALIAMNPGTFNNNDSPKTSSENTTQEYTSKYYNVNKHKHLRRSKYLEGFIDTPKPNAVCVIPLKDKNNVFKSSRICQFYSEIAKVYDSNQRVIKNKQELADMIDATPNIELLVIGGHGDGTGIMFGEDYLSKNDDEIGKHFRKLAPDAVIVVYSCMGAKYDLADKIKEWAGPSRTVIASKDEFTPYGVKVEKYYPFDMTINSCNIFTGFEDLTYKK